MGADSKSMCAWRRIAAVAILMTCANLLAVAGSSATDSFGTLAPGDRERLVKMAVCAKAAYPHEALPTGYRAMTRAEWDNLASGCPDGVYSDDGYLTIWDGLRGRLMVHVASERRVVAWSGCDDFTGGEFDGLKDLAVSIKHVLTGSVRRQYEQALAVCRGMVKASSENGLWVVGHSLGGSIVSYIAIAMDDCPDDVKFATFNGLGIYSSIVSSFGESSRARCSARLVNVYCDKDPVYNFFPGNAISVSKPERLVAEVRKLLSEILEMPAPEHPGQSFPLKYRITDADGNDLPEGIMDNLMPWTYYHGIRELIRQMEMLCPPVPAWHVWAWSGAGMLVVVVLLVWLFAVKRSN